MEPLAAAVRIAALIPDTDEYRHEREFSWLAVGRAAMVTGDLTKAELALERLGDERCGAELRLLGLHVPELRDVLLRDFVERLSFWQDYLFRKELSDLAPLLARQYGVIPAEKAALSIEDPFTRACFLVDLAAATTDRVVKRSLVTQAWSSAEEVEGDHDYALKHVVRGLIDCGLLAEAREAVESMRDPAIRLDYLGYLRSASEDAGEDEFATDVESQRERVAAENPEVSPQSELLAVARNLMTYELPGGAPSQRSVYGKIEELMDGGSYVEASARIVEHFRTQFLTTALKLPDGSLVDLMSAQLDAIEAYRRTDLKVEYLTDLALASHEAGRALPPQVETRLSDASFLSLEPPCPVSITSIDPSGMELDEFVRLLFDRPVHSTDDEERFMRRSRPDDPWISGSEALVRLAADLFESFGEIGPRYSFEQVDQGFWSLNSYPLNLWDHVTHAGVRIEAAERCIRAAHHVFADYVAVQDVPSSVTSLEMWWDQVWHDPSAAVLDAVLETLIGVLALGNEYAQVCALHGLNHLHPYPGTRAAIDAYLAQHGNSLPENLRRYAEACRNGDAL